MTILQISPKLAVNASHIANMELGGSGETVYTTITVKNRLAPVSAQGDWIKIWMKAKKYGWVWTDGRTHEMRA